MGRGQALLGHYGLFNMYDWASLRRYVNCQSSVAIAAGHGTEVGGGLKLWQVSDSDLTRKLCLFTLVRTKPQMLLRETIRKTKVLFHKTLRSFKSVIFVGYQKLPRSLSLNPFLGRSGNARTYTSDQFYNEFYDMLQSDLNRIKRVDDSSMRRSRDLEREDAANTETLKKQSSQKSVAVDGEVEEKKSKGSCELEKRECLNNSKSMDEGVHDLVQKMKELEMMDTGDVEHVLDIEEALHYYSRLTSPVYLDIVDKFFTDMHTEFSVQGSSISIKRSKSKGKLGSIRL
ncbi:unnamed protein product [Sphenostylis stenocarpa]|uniref:Uncharacterized protein n=1 Tax=Sphenostylis stenocarpa TaxID=92480 RepID=A0AA86VHK8_9FABA|nr:unnamed protein product [Sphenostylis stenocarpa]